ncbi:MAG: membrane protein insertase YidC [FCB group bacterium]|nr:membrane protein insertase YidC [FCB group bacterium]MBL7027284.1 membrane protein insertase YidC [Candidatus Neomarinimicrobiota bacterium]MBL7122254.1 membrane protein insertase YidC [Candidatus Neomarinimicrobiota bacterium]
MTEQNRTLVAIALMGLILMIFFSDWYQEKVAPGSTAPQKPHIESSFSSESDTTKQTAVAITPVVAPRQSLLDTLVTGNLTETRVIVNTPLYEMHFSNRGGGTLEKVYLNDYLEKDSSRVQLISDMAEGVLANQFIGYDVENFDTQELLSVCSLGEGYDIDFSVYEYPASFSFEIPMAAGAKIIRTFTFYPDSFHFDLSQELINFDQVNAGRYFATSWSGGIAPTEKNRKDDLYYSEMYALLGDDSSPSDYSADEDRESEVQTALTAWVGTRSKYFTAILIPEKSVSEFKMDRYQTPGGDDNSEKIFDFDVRDAFDRRSTISQSNYRVYVGPLDFDILKGYNLSFEEMMNWGWFGLIGKGALWVFKSLYSIIPNYGVVLIIFSILVKLLLAPLTKKQFSSTQSMQQAQPQITALKEKYKDDPKRLNEETMKLYKELGVNPLGGCLPLLIQMPILIAMFNLFRTTIELRGAAFGGLEFWISDLSLPDTVGNIAGIDINLLPIIMSATMMLQQKLMTPTANANPQMKNMPYIMTAVFFFMFYTFPSGLNLYYTLFNVMSIVQQKFFTPMQKLPASVTTPAPAVRPKKKRKK